MLSIKRDVLYQLSWEKWQRDLGLVMGREQVKSLSSQAEAEYAEVRIWDHFHNFVLDIMGPDRNCRDVILQFIIYLIIRPLFQIPKTWAYRQPLFSIRLKLV